MRTETEIKSLSSIAEGGLFSLVGLLFSIGLNLIFQFILIRHLSIEQIGLFNLGVAITSLVGVLLIFGLDRTVVYFISSHSQKVYQSKQWQIIFSSLIFLLLNTVIIGPIFWGGSDILAGFYNNEISFVLILRILLLGVIFGSFTRLLMGILEGYKQIMPVIVCEKIIIPLTRVICLIVLFRVYERSSPNASIAFLVGSITGFLLSIKHIYPYFKGDKPLLNIKKSFMEMLEFTWPLFGITFLNLMKSNIEIFILGAVSTIEQVGLFSISLKITFFLPVFTQAINVRLAPEVAETYSNNDIFSLNIIYKAVMRWGLIFTLPFAVFFFLDSTEILLFLNPEYVHSAAILNILVIAFTIFALDGPGALFLNMTRNTRINLFNLIVSIILSIILNLLLAQKFGALGASIAGGISYLFIFIFRLLQLKLLFRMNPFNKNFFKPIVSGIISGLILFILKGSLIHFSKPVINLFVHFVIFMFIYFILLSIFKLPNEDSLVMFEIKKRIKRSLGDQYKYWNK